MNLVIEQVKIEKPESDIDYFMVKAKKVIQKGITTPPPPTPAIVLRAMIIGRTIIPANSIPKIGNIFLCLHWPYLLQTS